MTRTLPILLAALVVAACSSAGVDNSFYLRFDTLLDPGGAAFVGSFRPALWKDRVFQTGRSGTVELLASGQRELTGIVDLTAMSDALFALQQGRLARSADGETFTDVAGSADKLFTELGGGDGVLVAMKRKSMGVAELFVSTDLGASWTQLADVDAGFTFGTGDSRNISHVIDGKVLISVGVVDDSFGNVNYAGQGYEFVLATQAIRLVSSTKEKLTGSPWPQHRSKEGLTFYVDTSDTVEQQGDATNVKVVLNPGATVDLKAAQRLRWTRPVLPYDASASLVVLGQDSQGRLLVAADKIYRSKEPLKGTDERALVLKGPGCDGRHTWTPDLSNDDSVTVHFENKTGQKVLLREIDPQMRWQRLKALEVDEKVLVNSLSNNASKQNVRLMVSDPGDDTCLGVYVVPMAKESTVTATKP